MAAGTRPDRVPALDVLRTIAVTLVLGHHPVFRWSSPEAALPGTLAWHAVGYTGVDLFFVLSGFLVSGLLFAEYARTGALDVRRFLVRRAFKIWPTYYFYLALLFAIAWRVGADLRPLVPMLVHLQNYTFETFPTHTWSLAVEEHFYLLAPPLVGAALRAGRVNAVPIGVLALVITCFAARAVDHAPVPAMLTHERVDSLAVGVAIAWLYHLHPMRFAALARWRWTLLAGGIGLVAAATAAAGHGAVTDALVATGQAFGYGGVLVSVVGAPGRARPDGLPSPVVRGLAWLGTHSYAVYLMHVDMGFRLSQALVALLGASLVDPSAGVWLAGTALYVATSFGAGVLVSRGVEMPALALRDRLFPSIGTPLR